MPKYLVIVESPAKTVKVQKYLNDLGVGHFTVKASMGHIYDLNGLKSIDITNGFTPTYTVMSSKSKTLNEIKKIAKTVDEVIIATDPDREGEGIGFHLAHYLKLNPNTTKRLRFHEITAKGIRDAWDSMESKLDQDLYNAQQARRILDLVVGYTLSPLLWTIRVGLSAGRCQTPALHLIRMRDDEVSEQKHSTFYALQGKFIVDGYELDAMVEKKFEVDEIETLKKHMNDLIGSKFKMTEKGIKKSEKNPPPPFITSTIQQELSNRLSLPPVSSMKILQRLYEAGKITYMRTDSTTISDIAINEIKNYVSEKYSPELFQYRKWGSKSKNAQEAHECIRPTHIEDVSISLSDLENKVYRIIHDRTVAALMTPNITENLKIEFSNEKSEYVYVGNFLKTISLGWMEIYTDEIVDEITEVLKLVSKEAVLVESSAVETLERQTGRYTEASIIAELERLGIGRPSTFSNIINTLSQRSYVEKDTKKGLEIDLHTFVKTLKKPIQETVKKATTQNEKNKLFITELGKIVDEYMRDNFGIIIDDKFTAEMEENLDLIANGKKDWVEVVDGVYMKVKPVAERLSKEKPKKVLEKKTIEKELGELDGIMVYLKFGPYGHYVEHNGHRSKTTPDISFDEAVGLIKKSTENIVREWKGIKIKRGPYGMYIQKGKQTVRFPETHDPMKITQTELTKVFKEGIEYKKKHKGFRWKKQGDEK